MFIIFISVLGTGLPDDIYLVLPLSKAHATGEHSVNPYPETENVMG
jgi:hypothetical protein